MSENRDARTSERVAALKAARSGEGISPEDMKVLGVDIPKAPDNGLYDIRPIAGKGYGCFASGPIKRGTRILSEKPLLVVPIADYFEVDVKAAFEKLSGSDQALYFTLHSAHGQDANKWPKHIHSSVPGRERCRIEEQHKARISKEPSLVSIFQTNCMEKENGAAVFPHAARFNHSCNPNAVFSWNASIDREIVHTMKDIKKDEEITFSYCDMTHDKITRRWELKHYGFSCDCPACSGDETDPDSFAAKSAIRRYRLMELERGFKDTRGESDNSGVQTPGFVEQLLEFAKLLIEEGDYTIRLASTYVDLALVCESNGDFKMALACAEKARKAKADCQGTDFADNEHYEVLVQRLQKLLLSRGARGN